MARYKPYSTAQGKFIAIRFDRQIQPGTFEYTLNHLIDHEFDLSIFDNRFKNDQTGAPAYDPKILLKIILYAYSRGMTSSRQIARCCEENIIFMALSADTRPHFTTIADFVSSIDKEVIRLFLEVLLVCDEQGLIGKEMFAIDGCKLPGNASKEWSGTRADFARKAAKMEEAITRIVAGHRANDNTPIEKGVRDREESYVKTLRQRVKKVREWLSSNEDKMGKSGEPIKSNITDNDSAKMKTGHGVIQGYNGVTAVDSKQQVIVHAEAFGQSQEHGLLEPMVKGTRGNFQALGDQDVFAKAKLAADSGFHTEQNMKMLYTEGIDAYVADGLFRKRDPRFTNVDKYKERHRKERAKLKVRRELFTPDDFIFSADLNHCICPAGKRLNRNGSNRTLNNFQAFQFKGTKSACLSCKLRSKCLRHPERTPVRQVAYLVGRSEKGKSTFTQKMKHKIDSPVGRMLYSLRLAIAEPPFAHIRSAIGLKRFTLRGRFKVDTQWKLFCIVHNIKKVHQYAPGSA